MFFPSSEYFSTNSRRSPVLSLHGIASTSNPLASFAAVSILQKGGNAVEASIAASAVLAVCEPCSTGLGGDCFALVWNNQQKKIFGLDGCGKSSRNLTLQKFNDSKRGQGKFVTVPGAVDAWLKLLEEFSSGQVSREEIFQFAISHAENGFAVSPITAWHWNLEAKKLRNAENGHELLVDGRRAPKAGEIWKNPALAKIFRKIVQHGRDAFYTGDIARKIVEVVQRNGGVLDLEDLKENASEFVEPISIEYQGAQIFEIPPSGQGITALLALNILKHFPIKHLQHNSAEYLHILIEAMRLAFADSRTFVADPRTQKNVPIKELLNDEYAISRSQLIDFSRANENISHGSPLASSDTVSFSVVDSLGNAVSFVNSNFMGFGTGIVPENCGFSLQNRGLNFSTLKDHLNCAGPSKRPYHTIIPGMALRNSEFLCAFNVMGGFMQPQGHVQVLSNILNFNMDPQAALDAPRFCILAEIEDQDNSQECVMTSIGIEDGISLEDFEKLQKYGHSVQFIRGQDRYLFGRGQIIFRMEDASSKRSIYWAGSDPRADGCAIGL